MPDTRLQPERAGVVNLLPVSLKGVVVPVVGECNHQANILLGRRSNDDVKALECLHSQRASI